MVDGILKFNLMENGLEESTRSLSRYYAGTGDAPKLNKNLFLNLNVPIPALNYIIDQSKNYVAGHANYQRWSQETFRHSKNLLDIIMRISLQRKARTNEGQRTGEKAHPTDGGKEAEQPKGEELTGQAAKHVAAAKHVTAAKHAAAAKQGHAAQKGQNVEGLQYYPGFCMQLGAKGRRCLLELIRRVYKEKTSTCKNILAHKLKPPECISNLPFFNIHMLWKLSYEFGVFEEALKIHKTYGQSSGTFTQLLNGTYSMQNSSTCESGDGTIEQRQLSEEKSGANGSSRSGESYNEDSNNGERGKAGRKRKRQECTQGEAKYNFNTENAQKFEGAPLKQGTKKTAQICARGEVTDGRRIPIESATWTNWRSGSEVQATQCVHRQFESSACPTEGRSKQRIEAQGTAPPKGTTDGPPNRCTLPSRRITSGANPRGEEGKRESIITSNNASNNARNNASNNGRNCATNNARNKRGDTHVEKALPNLIFNDKCESCRMNRAYSRRSLLKESHNEKKEATAGQQEEEQEEEDREPIKTYEITNNLKVDSVEELLSNFVHISNAIILHLKKNKGTSSPKAQYNLLSDHCLLLIPIKQQKRRKRARRNAHEGNEPSAQRTVHQQDGRGVEQMKNDRVFYEVGVSHSERGSSTTHRLSEHTNEKSSATQLGNFASPNSSMKESVPRGQCKTGQWGGRQQCCSPTWAKRKKLTNDIVSGMTSGVTPVRLPTNTPFESPGGGIQKVAPVNGSARTDHIPTCPHNGSSANWGGSCATHMSDMRKTTHKRKNPNDSTQGTKRK
ncbi:hypothetical protein AK88_00367 [Plasmodium fragile]|uniref:Uncharacterized protein n=1 Tax=Plasmodium fragile TaxID=5857 RepID=A0A0D9QU74_PLAFR|nr:uncharacterized protein AK88_00367 [Plasmodium fragile]KJP89911.1 hypothetical protein AK88_00367 [Plasmodium fragile]